MIASRSGLLTSGLRILCLSSCVATAFAGCSGNKGPAPGAVDSKSAARPPQVTDIPQVDASQLTDSEKKLWLEVVNDQLSPCGEPISVARCAAEQHKCGACVTAARYVARLVMDGYDRTTL